MLAINVKKVALRPSTCRFLAAATSAKVLYAPTSMHCNATSQAYGHDINIWSNAVYYSGNKNATRMNCARASKYFFESDRTNFQASIRHGASGCYHFSLLTGENVWFCTYGWCSNNNYEEM